MENLSTNKRKNKAEEEVLEETEVEATKATKKTERKEKPTKTANAQEETEAPKTARFGKILGLLLVLSAIALTYSFISYLFTVTEDQSDLYNNLANTLTDNSTKVKNQGGRLGAVLSHFFIHQLFGFASFIFCGILMLLGINLLFETKIFQLLKVSLYGLLLLVWGAMLGAFLNGLIYPTSVLAWGGGFGNYLTGNDGQLTGLISPLGVALLLFFMAVSLFIWMYNFNFDFLLNLFSKKEISFIQSKKTSNNFSKTEDQPPFDADIYRDDSENIFGKDKIEQQNNLVKNELLTIENLQDIEEENKNYKLEEAEEDGDMEMQIIAPKEEAISDLPYKPNLSTPFDPTQELSKYEFPGIELLDEHGGEKVKYNPEELEQNKNQIISTLNNYAIEISKIKATIGPTVTLYEIVPAPGVRISKIKNLEDDIALSLAALGIRIIAPIPGKGTIGIEVPNVTKEVVSMRSLLASEKFQNTTADLPICLGKTIANEIIVADLAKMPHLLMAGATGQGKSVGINSILVSLLYKKHPSQLKFIMVDPKKVELSLYETLEKHYLAKLPGEDDAIITDIKKVVTTLNALCLEMDNRYDLLKKAQVRNIKEYNHKFINRQLNPQNGHQFLPYIVLVVDEFADLIMTAGKEVEMPIARLAQLARAIGIHLILATQRPSVNIITGTIKANFPARIAFKTTSKIDSRTILDTGGSEQLIGRGDMLLSQGSDIVRLQCGFVDTPEVERIRDFISNQQGFSEAFLLPEYIDPNAKDGGDELLGKGELDPMFADAARVIVQNQMGSTSLIQRRLKLGYNRAGRLMDQLESAGIVGENLGSKAREVRVKTELELEQFLQNMNNV